MPEFITTDEWLAELEKLQGEDRGERPANTFRMEELCEHLGICRQVISRGLRTAIRDGRVRVVRVPLRDLSGRATMVPAYQLVKEEGSKPARRK